MNDNTRDAFTVESLVIRVGDIVYEARLHYPDVERPERASVIAPPHPFLGGNFDNNVVTSLAGALATSGYAVLTYNLPGVGKSSSRPRGAATREDFWQSNASGEELSHDAWDYLRLRDHLLDLTQLEDTAFRAAGYSYGSSVLWEAAGLGRLHGVALVSPPETLLETMKTTNISAPALCLFAENDLAFGDRGPSAADGLDRTGLEVRLLQGADHFFRDHLDPLCRIVIQHFESAPKDSASLSSSNERS